MPQPQSTFINPSANDMISYQREDGLLDKCAIPSFFSTVALEMVLVSGTEEQRSGVLLNATLSTWELDSMLPHLVPIFLFPSFAIPSWSLFPFAYKITKCSPIENIFLFCFVTFPCFQVKQWIFQPVVCVFILHLLVSLCPGLNFTSSSQPPPTHLRWDRMAGVGLELGVSLPPHGRLELALVGYVPSLR